MDVVDVERCARLAGCGRIPPVSSCPGRDLNPHSSWEEGGFKGRRGRPASPAGAQTSWSERRGCPASPARSVNSEGCQKFLCRNRAGTCPRSDPKSFRIPAATGTRASFTPLKHRRPRPQRRPLVPPRQWRQVTTVRRSVSSRRSRRCAGQSPRSFDGRFGCRESRR